MSRGPGRLERIIAQAFAEHPSEAFTAARLVALAYPEVPPKQIIEWPLTRKRVAVGIAKRYRSAILRAAKHVVPCVGWATMKAQAPGGPPVFYNPCDLNSYACAMLLWDYGNFHQPYFSDPKRLKESDNKLAAAKKFWPRFFSGTPKTFSQFPCADSTRRSRRSEAMPTPWITQRPAAQLARGIHGADDHAAPLRDRHCGSRHYLT